MNWNWLIVQVVIPIIGPIVLSAMFAFAWSTGPAAFHPKIAIIVDITPRALTFYCLVLISMSVSQIWHKLNENPFVGGSAIVMGVLVAVYYAFTVVWRHDATYIPTAETYYVTVVLTAGSIIVCHMCQRRLQNDERR